MGLNEDLGDRENIGNASVSAQRSRATDNLGATEEEVRDSLREDVALAFKTCNRQRTRIAELECQLAAAKKGVICREEEMSALASVNRYEFLNPKFLELMNDIGRLGHEKFKNDAFESNGSKRKIPRHQKDEIMRHAHCHLWSYEDGAPHDELGLVSYHLAAAAFNVMLEFIFSQGE